MDEAKATEVLLDALKRAAAAHGVYEAEELAGVWDEAWPEWYTAHMVRTLREGGYALAQTGPDSEPDPAPSI